MPVNRKHGQKQQHVLLIFQTVTFFLSVKQKEDRDLFNIKPTNRKASQVQD